MVRGQKGRVVSGCQLSLSSPSSDLLSNPMANYIFSCLILSNQWWKFWHRFFAQGLKESRTPGPLRQPDCGLELLNLPSYDYGEQFSSLEESALNPHIISTVIMQSLK